MSIIKLRQVSIILSTSDNFEIYDLDSFFMKKLRKSNEVIKPFMFEVFLNEIENGVL